MKTKIFPSSKEEFAPYEAMYTELTKIMSSMPLLERRVAFDTAIFPANAPVRGVDFETEERTIKSRDGGEVSLRIYRNLKVKGDGKSLLVLRIHGGGMLFFSFILDGMIGLRWL